MRNRGRLILAILLAIVCGTVAVVSVFRSTVPVSVRREPPAVRPEIRAFFDGLKTGIVSTSPEAWPRAEATAREALSKHIASLDARSLPPMAALAETFTGDLHAMVSGDFDAFVRGMRKQGILIEASEAQRAAWLAAAKLVNWAAFDPSAVSVRVFSLNGNVQPRPAGRPSLGTGTSSRHYPSSKLPACPDAGDLTILEVEFPMAIVVSEDTSQRKPRVVQFRYAWNKEVGSWSLWAIGTLTEPGDRTYGWPL